MRYITLIFYILFFVFCSLPVHAQQRYDYDVASTVGSISFVPPQIKAGEPLRIYGTIVNVGNQDLTGHVGFYQGTFLIGDPQPFSLKANGVPEEVWVDWTPPEGTYNIMMTILQTKPEDQNPSNNVSLTPLLTVRKTSPPPVQVQNEPPPTMITSVSATSSATQHSDQVSKKDESVVDSSTVPQKQLIPKTAVRSKLVSPSLAPVPVAVKPTSPTKNDPTIDIQARKATNTEMMATTTSAVEPLAQQYSEQLRKLTEQQIEVIDYENPPQKTDIQEDGAISDEGASNRFIMIGSSVAVAFLLIGLIFLKRSGIV